MDSKLSYKPCDLTHCTLATPPCLLSFKQQGYQRQALVSRFHLSRSDLRMPPDYQVQDAEPVSWIFPTSMVGSGEPRKTE